MGTRSQVWRTGCQAGLGTGDPCVVATHMDGDMGRGAGGGDFRQWTPVGCRRPWFTSGLSPRIVGII